MHERDNPYYFFPANQEKAGTKIYSLTQCSLTVNECDWHILAGNNKRINSHCLTRLTLKSQPLIFFQSWDTQNLLFPFHYCYKYWWTNLLYINTLYPYDINHTVSTLCAKRRGLGVYSRNTVKESFKIT